jgi:hypothetical protein
MNETKWERYGAGAGIAFVVLMVIGTFVVPTAPHIDASTARIAGYVTNHRHGLITSMLLGSLAVLAFLWFMGHLRHVLHRSESGAEALSPMVFGAGVATAVLGMLAALPMGTLAFMAGRPADPTSPAVIRLLFDMNWMLGAMTGLAAGLFLVTGSLAMIRREMVSPNVGWMGMLFAALLWISSAGDMYLHSYSRGLDVIGLIGLLGFLLWTLVSSLAMYRQPEVERTTAHHAVFA